MKSDLSQYAAADIIDMTIITEDFMAEKEEDHEESRRAPELPSPCKKFSQATNDAKQQGKEKPMERETDVETQQE
jgi:hypothetical protein